MIAPRRNRSPLENLPVWLNRPTGLILDHAGTFPTSDDCNVFSTALTYQR